MKRRIGQYGKAHECFLSRGCWFFDPHPFRQPGERSVDEVAVRAAWSGLGPELMAAWVGEKPGTRPWGFWQFDAPDERRRRTGPNGVGEWAETEAEYLDRHPDLWWTGERERWRTDAERAADAAKTRQLAGANGEDQGETRTAAGCDRRTRGIGE